MDKVKTLEIRCLNPDCGKWFPSPITVDDSQTFDIMLAAGNKVQCPECHEITPCNKENMRMFSQRGGFRGKDTL